MIPELGTAVLAHGIGGRTDLPMAAPLAVAGSLWAVAASFVAVTVVWPAARSGRAGAGRVLPAALQRVGDSAPLRLGLQLLVLLVAVFVAVVAFTGPQVPTLNLAPYALYITFWVGLVPVSLLFGSAWRVVNPLRVIHRGVSGLLRRSPAAGPVALPEHLGWWPGAGWLAVFLWLELVAPFHSEPVVVGTFMLVYAAVNLTAALVYGARWFDRGDGFEAYSSLVGRLSPLGRRDDGLLVLRNPLDGVAGLRDEPGLLAALLVLIGGTAFDGLTRSRLWVQTAPEDSVLVGTLGLVVMVTLVSVLYHRAMVVVRRVSREEASASVARLVPAGAPAAGVYRSPLEDDPTRVRATAGINLPGWFAPSLVPIAVGYVIAHYFSLLLLEGQQTWLLLGDPFGAGAGTPGTGGARVDYTLLSTTTISYIQIGAIVVGHVVGVLTAHDRAVRAFGEQEARRSQYPLMAIMLLFTGIAVALLVST